VPKRVRVFGTSDLAGPSFNGRTSPARTFEVLSRSCLSCLAYLPRTEDRSRESRRRSVARPARDRSQSNPTVEDRLFRVRGGKQFKGKLPPTAFGASTRKPLSPTTGEIVCHREVHLTAQEGGVSRQCCVPTKAACLLLLRSGVDEARLSAALRAARSGSGCRRTCA